MKLSSTNPNAHCYALVPERVPRFAKGVLRWDTLYRQCARRSLLGSTLCWQHHRAEQQRQKRLVAEALGARGRGQG